jgi:predicted transcriptional regulator
MQKHTTSIVKIETLQAGDTVRLGRTRDWHPVVVESIQVVTDNITKAPDGSVVGAGRVLVNLTSGGWVAPLLGLEVEKRTTSATTKIFSAANLTQEVAAEICEKLSATEGDGVFVNRKEKQIVVYMIRSAPLPAEAVNNLQRVAREHYLSKTV